MRQQLQAAHSCITAGVKHRQYAGTATSKRCIHTLGTRLLAGSKAPEAQSASGSGNDVACVAGSGVGVLLQLVVVSAHAVQPGADEAGQ